MSFIANHQHSFTSHHRFVRQRCLLVETRHAEFQRKLFSSHASFPLCFIRNSNLVYTKKKTKQGKDKRFVAPHAFSLPATTPYHTAPHLPPRAETSPLTLQPTLQPIVSARRAKLLPAACLCLYKCPYTLRSRLLTALCLQPSGYSLRPPNCQRHTRFRICNAFFITC